MSAVKLGGCCCCCWLQSRKERQQSRKVAALPMPSFSAFLPNHWLLQQRRNGFILVNFDLGRGMIENQIIIGLSLYHWMPLQEEGFGKSNWLQVGTFVQKCCWISSALHWWDRAQTGKWCAGWMNLCGSGVTQAVTHNSGLTTMMPDLSHVGLVLWQMWHFFLLSHLSHSQSVTMKSDFGWYCDTPFWY